MPHSWEFVDSAVPQDVRERVLLAALDELTRWGIERFSVAALAARHGIEEADVHRYWGSGQRLVLDVMFFRSEGVMAAPDTGSLRGDLEAMALSVAAYLNTEVGRRLLRAVVKDTHVHVPDDTRMIYWRRRFETVRTILDRAALRGELREGVHPVTGVQILLAPINIRGLYTDDPIDEAYCLSVADLAWRALVRR
ncbi:transcriptional regulator, TetR family [Mycolicibacterium chubuense NBB4]|uniref:Transcriptional regulator, TetR family n=1 Tax=Mycolicibacterium chubuense (strain NBB4) TaxID=710421 RepID=I4BR84_MYCCN|nr:TetR-like C-terminal domain-containing protein [Mycolicibacterium chubuense]AFM19791.1 transcriptional regulator, TetR family [Mycolicibacterium chubuense NBB4]